MSAIGSINELLQSGEPLVRDLAAKAVRYKAQLDNEALTPEEYGTLRAQLLDLEALHSAAVRAEERQALLVAVEFLKTYLPLAI